MLSLVTLVNSIFSTYLDSLKRDLSKDGFAIIVLILAISLLGSPLVVLALLFLGKFQMPVDPRFYLIWFGVTGLAVIQYAFFIIGMVKTRFLAAETFSSLSFATTIIYAVLLLHETLDPLQTLAVVISFVGAAFFFNWRSFSKMETSSNAGLFMVLFSIFLAPLGSILYKSATFHTTSYHQFLSGRVVMDLTYYSIFFLLLFVFWYKKNPFPQMMSFASSAPGAIFTVGEVAVNLVGSYLFFKMPVPFLTILGVISIPTGYAIGHIKYKERIGVPYIVGGILIVLALILFVRAG